MAYGKRVGGEVLVMEGGCGLWEESGWGGASDGGWVWLMGREWGSGGVGASDGGWVWLMSP